MSRPFLDTNVLLYSLAGDDPRQAVAVRLLAGSTVSVQVLNEFASVAHRKTKLSWPEVARASSDVRALCSPPVPLTLISHEQAVKLAAHNGIAFDALIVASVLEAGCDMLLPKDMLDGQDVESRLVIRNSFRR